MCVHFLELPFLKCNENASFSFKNVYNKEKGSFLFESEICCYFYYFLNNALDKVYSEQLRSYDPAKLKKLVGLNR